MQITLAPPDGWREDASLAPPGGDLEVAFRGPIVDGVPTIMSLTRATAKVSHGLELEVPGLVKGLLIGMPDAKVIGKTFTRYGSDEVARIDLAYRSAPNGFAPKSHSMREFAIQHGGIVYNFTLLCSSSAFPQIAEIFEKSLATIKWSAAIPSQNIVFNELGFSATTPPGWRLVMPDDADFIPGAVTVRAPEADGVRPNFLIKMLQVPGPVSLNQVAAQSVALLRSRPNTTVQGETMVRLDGVDAAVWDVIAPPKTPDGPVLYLREALTIRNGRQYVFLFTADRRIFETGQAAFAQFMLSLRWLPGGSARVIH